MKYVALLVLLLGCAGEEGPKFSVRVTAIAKAESAYYCTYLVESTTSEPIPKDHFMDECGTHNVGDVLEIEFGDNR